MLKFTYSESSFHLEHYGGSVEEVVTRWAIVALRSGERVCIQSSTAAFLLPTRLPAIRALETEVQQYRGDEASVCIADAEYLEFSLKGTWIGIGTGDCEGVFLTRVSDRLEFYILKCWQEIQFAASVMTDAGEL